jgi:hypothetical protein
MSEIKMTVNTNPCKDEGKGFEAWWEERSLTQKVLLGIGFAACAVALLAIFGFFVMLLWNWLMPDIFGLKTISYWQAWGLLILSWILFKGSKFGESSASMERKRKRALRRAMREGPAPSETDAAGSGDC